MVLIEVVYAVKLAPKHVNFANFCAVNAKCGAAKMYGLHLGLQFLIAIPLRIILNYYLLSRIPDGN